MMAKTPAPRPPKKIKIVTPWLLPIAPPQAVSAAEIAARSDQWSRLVTTSA